MAKRKPKKSWYTKSVRVNKKKKHWVDRVKTTGQYWVEAIRDHMVDGNGRLRYLLKWEDWDEKDNSWEFDQHVTDCPEARAQFALTLNGRHPPKNSWEEFDKFVTYMRNAISYSFTDLAVLHRLSDKKYSFRELRDNRQLVCEAKTEVEVKLKDFFIRTFDRRQANSERIKAKDLALNVFRRLRMDAHFGSMAHFFEFVDRRAEMETNLKKWQNEANRVIAEKGEGSAISVANDVDGEVPEGKYICDCIYDKKQYKRKTSVERFAVHSCQCTDCYDGRHECCTAVVGFPMVYNRKGVLSHSKINSTVIFECNYMCKCGPDCPNRVIQRGRQYRLEVFRTEDAAVRGWGVRALEDIPKGAFISRYCGEIISLGEANGRPTTYLFDLGTSLDTEDNEYTYVIDADSYGNIGKYVNHSCEPNSRVIFSWIDSYDRLLPTVSMFAIRRIRAYEEITYDYGMEIINIYDQNVGSEAVKSEDSMSTDSGNASSVTDSSVRSATARLKRTAIEDKPQKVTFKKIECLCGADKCRKYLYS